MTKPSTPSTRSPSDPDSRSRLLTSPERKLRGPTARTQPGAPPLTNVLSVRTPAPIPESPANHTPRHERHLECAMKFTSLLIAAVMLTGCASPQTDSPTNPELRQALLDLREQDQTARQAFVDMMKDVETADGGGFSLDAEQAEIMHAMAAIDAESTAFLKETVTTYGWPTFTMVGEDGAAAAWLLAQHADADPDFQTEVLELMRPPRRPGPSEPAKLRPADRSRSVRPGRTAALRHPVHRRWRRHPAPLSHRRPPPTSTCAEPRSASRRWPNTPRTSPRRMASRPRRSH